MALVNPNQDPVINAASLYINGGIPQFLMGRVICGSNLGVPSIDYAIEAAGDSVTIYVSGFDDYL